MRTQRGAAWPLSLAVAGGLDTVSGTGADTRPQRPGWRDTMLAPFRHRIFLLIWLASLVSNFGATIQSVGASWLMTTIAPSADMVALVQACTSLPIMLFSLPAGAAADIYDRRIVMLVAQGLMLFVSAGLAVTAGLGLMTPFLLLAFTFLIACGSAINGPAWQASVGDQVPRADLSAAVSLNALNFNIARTLGPAIGGLIVAAAGPRAAFLINALSYGTLIAVLLAWRPERPASDLPPERMRQAIVTGLRYARRSPPIRIVVARSVAFGFLGSAVWALLPLIARDLLGGGPLTYGLLLGALGAGAVLGALASARVRQFFPTETIVSGGSAVFGMASLVAAASPFLPLTMTALLAGGGAWVTVLSTFNVSVQLSIPRWVVGRAVAVYQTVTFGGMAVGSWLWGIVAHEAGLSVSLAAAGLGLGASLLLGAFVRLPNAGSVDLEPSKVWPDPEVHMPIEPSSGPIVVTVEYRVPVARQAAFADLMLGEIRRMRERDGAQRWGLLQDLSDPEIFFERFQNPTWLDHLRLHGRVTATDLSLQARALAFHEGPAAPSIRHFASRSSPDHL